MTAINVVRSLRHSRLFVLADAASYTSDGTVMGFCTKVFPVAHWPGCIACRGSGVAMPLLGYQLALEFKEFDAVVDGVEATLPTMAQRCETFTDACGMSRIEIILGGWSKRRNRPESYMIATSDEILASPEEIEQARKQGGSRSPADPFTLQDRGDVSILPATPEQLASGDVGIEDHDDPAGIVADMMRVMEEQRQAKFDVPGGKAHIVGGFAELVKVSPTDVQQSILRRWDEDWKCIGGPLTPTPALTVVSNSERMSRLQREIAARKAKKQQRLRAV